MSRSDMLNSLVLKACSPGMYLGNEAQAMLNKIAKSLHINLLRICKEYSNRNLLRICYDMFDKACYNFFAGNYLFSDDISLIKKSEVAPSVFSYLINVILCSGSESSKRPAESELIPIVAIASLLIEACNLSDLLFYTNFEDDGFEVSETGALAFTISRRTQGLQERLLEKVAKRRMTMETGELYGDPKSLKSQTKPYDEPFRDRYKIRLSEICEIMENGIRRINKPPGAIRSSYREFVKKFRKGSNLSKSTIRRAVSFFELNSDALTAKWRYYKLYEMRPSSSRQPILRISGDVGQDGVIMFGRNALLRALGLLIADVDRGVIDLGSFSQHWLQQKGVRFEQQVRNLIAEYRFRVLHITKTSPSVGEIDCVAYNRDLRMLLIIEAKSLKIDLSVKETKWQISNARKWCSQLKRKAEWVRSNLTEVARQLGISPKDIHEIKDLIVVEVPTFSDDSTSSKIATIEDLFYMLESTCTRA